MFSFLAWRRVVWDRVTIVSFENSAIGIDQEAERVMRVHVSVPRAHECYSERKKIKYDEHFPCLDMCCICVGVVDETGGQLTAAMAGLPPLSANRGSPDDAVYIS